MGAAGDVGAGGVSWCTSMLAEEGGTWALRMNVGPDMLAADTGHTEGRIAVVARQTTAVTMVEVIVMVVVVTVVGMVVVVVDVVVVVEVVEGVDARVEEGYCSGARSW